MSEHQLLIDKYIKLKNKYLSTLRKTKECPICKCSSMQKEFKDILRLKNAEVYHLTEDWYISCNNCGLIMKEGIYSDDYQKEYLNEFYTVDAINIEPYSYTKANTRLNFINSLNVKFKNILEVSSFDGVTIAKLKEYFKCDVLGIEPTSSAVETSIKEFPELDGLIINDVFENYLNYEKNDNKFDLVIFSHCFRHFNDPLKSLEILSNITEEGAFVLIDEGAFIETILISATKEQVQRELFQQKTFYYSKHNLEYLLATFGFKLNQSLYNDLNNVRYSGLIFQKDSSCKKDINLIEISKANTNYFLNLMKKFYYSTHDIIETLKKYG